MTRFLFYACLVLVLSGCALFKGRIKAGGVTVNGVADGNGASLASDKSAAVLPLPAGSKLTVTKWEPVAWQPATGTRPEVKSQPAREVTEVTLSRDTQWRKDETKIVADTGTIDTTVAVRRLEIAERKWLLWAAIACAVGGLVVKASFPAWPSISNGLLLAAVAAGAAWKLSDIPAWTWLAVIGVAVLLVMGYKRREKDEREAKEELLRTKAVPVVVVPTSQ